MPDDPPPLDFAARVSQRRAMAEAYRVREQRAMDELLRKVYSGLATTYENMAHEIEQTASRIESIKLATARARSRIANDGPRQVEGFLKEIPGE